MTKDQIVRAITSDGYIKAVSITSTNIVERARNIHNTTPVASAALGRTLTAAAMMSNMLKIADASLTIRINGGGGLGTIMVVADCYGNVRGYVQNPDFDLPLKSPQKLDVGGAVGINGQLTVIKDLNLKEPYIGSVQLISGEIAEDIAAYFVESEQIPTACALGVLVDRDHSILAAGGYIIQLLPGAPEESIEKLEKGIAKTGAVTSILKDGISAQELLSAVMADFELEFFPAEDVEYRCYCSRDKVKQVLFSLGESDLDEMIESGETIEVTCQFCDNLYHFPTDDLKKIKKESKFS